MPCVDFGHCSGQSQWDECWGPQAQAHDHELALDQAPQVLRRMRNGEHFGKVAIDLR